MELFGAQPVLAEHRGAQRALQNLSEISGARQSSEELGRALLNLTVLGNSSAVLGGPWGAQSSSVELGRARRHSAELDGAMRNSAKLSTAQ